MGRVVSMRCVFSARVVGFIGCAIVTAPALADGWSAFAGSSQHTGISPTASLPLDHIKWQTPVDLNPQYSGSELLIHYGSPVITPANTVIVPVKTGATDGFKVEGRSGADGSLKWSFNTDYALPPVHGWTPPYGPVLANVPIDGGGSIQRLYYAGSGGSIYYINNPDSNTPSAPVQVPFYGTTVDNSLGSSVYINTPLTADASGNVIFGFQVTGANDKNLTSGIARVAANGTGSWISAATAANDANITKPLHACAPALSNDGSKIYIAVNDGNGGGFGSSGYLVELNNIAGLSPVARVHLQDVKTPANSAQLPDSGSATPTVGPDGDVYMGVLDYIPQNNDRGYLLHFSGDLSQTKTPGSFGWDDTASIVPASMVNSYHGSSAYLLATKFNNSGNAGLVGDGVNKLAILDPNATTTDPLTGATVMQIVMSIAGVTPDQDIRDLGHPNAVKEWCINNVVVDPATHSILANSEDGKLYRWNLDSNSFTEAVTLTAGLGEAYTPTFIGPDGTTYAINNGTLFAVVPEPASLGLLAGALLVSALRRRRPRNRN